jgi:hypothetical protein
VELLGDERFSRAAHAQTAGHLTGSEERGGCKSLERLRAFPALHDPRPSQEGMSPASAGSCGDSSRVEPEHATLEIRVRFSVTAPSQMRASCIVVGTTGLEPLRSSEEGAPHERGPGSSTLPVATDRNDPECSNSRIRGFEPQGWGCKSLLRNAGPAIW